MASSTASSSSPAVDDPDAFSVGSIVLLDGLVNKPELNGRVAEIVSTPTGEGRFGVRFLQGFGKEPAPPVSVQRTNLVPQSPGSPPIKPCNGCGHSFGIRYLMKCRKCRRADYCSRECQVGHWKREHKQMCELLRTSRKETDDDLPSIQNIDDRVRARVTRGMRHMQTSNYAAAELEWRRLISECPADQQFHLFHSFLANALYRQDHLDEALATYIRALELPLTAAETPSDYGKTWFRIGLVLKEKKEYEDALEAFKLALEINPQNSEIQLVMDLMMQDELGL